MHKLIFITNLSLSKVKTSDSFLITLDFFLKRNDRFKKKKKNKFYDRFGLLNLIIYSRYSRHSYEKQWNNGNGLSDSDNSHR